MEFELPSLVLGFLGSIGGAGVALGAARQRLRRVEEDVERIETEMDKHVDTQATHYTEMVDRLARIETVVTQIDKRLK